jgi:hypothetical protein
MAETVEDAATSGGSMKATMSVSASPGAVPASPSRTPRSDSLQPAGGWRAADSRAAVTLARVFAAARGFDGPPGIPVATGRSDAGTGHTYSSAKEVLPAQKKDFLTQEKHISTQEKRFPRRVKRIPWQEMLSAAQQDE